MLRHAAPAAAMPSSTNIEIAAGKGSAVSGTSTRFSQRRTLRPVGDLLSLSSPCWATRLEGDWKQQTQSYRLAPLRLSSSTNSGAYMEMVTRKRHRTTQPAVAQNHAMAGRSEVDATRNATKFVREVSMIAVPPLAKASPSRSSGGSHASAASNASVSTRISSTPTPTAKKITSNDTSVKGTPHAIAMAKPAPSANITRHTAPAASESRERRRGRPPSMSAMKIRINTMAPAMNGLAAVTFREISSSTAWPEMPTTSTSGSAPRLRVTTSWNAVSHDSTRAS
mmetsp:Transcript_93049/g.249659  ORF Transcript_93049/g.249659 Transcript_93049/m.249659 type:complete len:282 (+) Transcript_93049:1311-2156(+)